MQQKRLSAAISHLPSKLVEENDQKYGDIFLVRYIKEKACQKRYKKYEVQRLFKRKDREREIDAGRHSKLNKRDRILMLLVYYCLYITCFIA